jgi:hypothetical protein
VLAAEPLILARLTAQLALISPEPDVLPRVCSSATIAGTVDVAQHCPLVVVHPASASKAERTPDDLLYETQTWKVVVVVKNIPNTRDFSADYQAAGVLLQAIVLALEGWEPATSYNAMRYTARLETEVGAGFSEFPLEFTTRFALSTVLAEPSPDAFITANVTQDIKPPVATSGEPEAVDNVSLPQ